MRVRENYKHFKIDQNFILKTLSIDKHYCKTS